MSRFVPYQVNAKSVQNGTVKVVSCLESCRSTVSDDVYSCSNMEFPKTGVRCCKLFFFNSFNPIIKKTNQLQYMSFSTCLYSRSTQQDACLKWTSSFALYIIFNALQESISKFARKIRIYADN